MSKLRSITYNFILLALVFVFFTACLRCSWGVALLFTAVLAWAIADLKDYFDKP